MIVSEGSEGSRQEKKENRNQVFTRAKSGLGLLTEKKIARTRRLSLR